VPLDAEY
jgi:hypothetical protein